MYSSDVQSASAFLTALMAPYKPGAARIELRTLAKTGSDSSRRRPRGWYALNQIDRAAKDAIAWAHRGRWDVYMGVLPRTPGGGGAAHLRLCGFLWCDVDGGGQGPDKAFALLRDAYESGLVYHPHLITCSGGGIHAYWRLEHPLGCTTSADHERVRQYLRRICKTVGGEPDSNAPWADIASTDPARILRVPGTLNYKQERPRPVRLLLNRPEVPAMSIADWGTLLPAEQLPPPRPVTNVRPASYRETGSLPPTILRRMSDGVRPGEIHNQARLTAVWARREGLSEAEIRSYVERIFEASGIPVAEPAEARKIDAMARWAVTNVQPVEPSPTAGGVHK